MRRAVWVVALLGAGGLALADEGRFESRGDGGWRGGGRLEQVDRRGDDHWRHDDRGWRDNRGWRDDRRWRDDDRWSDRRGHQHRDGHWDRGWHRGWDGPRFRPAPRHDYYPYRYRHYDRRPYGYDRPWPRDRYYRDHHRHRATLDLILSLPL